MTVNMVFYYVHRIPQKFTSERSAANKRNIMKLWLPSRG